MAFGISWITRIAGVLRYVDVLLVMVANSDVGEWCSYTYAAKLLDLGVISVASGIKLLSRMDAEILCYFFYFAYWLSASI